MVFMMEEVSKQAICIVLVVNIRNMSPYCKRWLVIDTQSVICMLRIQAGKTVVLA